MGVAVGNFATGHKLYFSPQHLNNMIFDLVHMLASKQLNIIAEQAVIHHIVKGANTVLLGHGEIFHTVIWCCMHTASTGIGGDMVAQQYRNIAL